MIHRLPLRGKLALAFAAASAVVLVAVGSFLYFRTKSNLDASIDVALRARARELAAVAQVQGSGRRLADQDPFFELLDARGRVVASSASKHLLVLSPSELRRARRGTLLRYRGERTRLLARPAGRGRVLVVGSPLRQREHALETLAASLLVGGPLALLIAAAGGWLLAGAALRPVDSMRRRAEEISRADERARLPLPAARDEVRRLGETLNSMLERVAASAEHERRFVAEASHELRTPLAILRTELELAMRDGGDRERLEQAVASALEEVDRLARLADDLLLLARADEHALDAGVEAVDLDPLLRRVAARYRRTAPAAGRRVHVRGSGLRVRADAPRLEQAIANLVDNALAHGRGDVELHARAAAGVVEVHVRDAGAGFPREFLPRAFDRFSRPPGTRTGSGLGLAIVDAVATAHGGEAVASNAPGGGADVWIALPPA